MQHSARSRAIALICGLLAVCLLPTSRLVAGPHGAVVHVRWQASIEPATRLQLEQRFRLTNGRSPDGRTWLYDLTDPSRENIRALVVDPSVADTHDIDRSAFAVAPSAPRTGRRLRFAAGDRVVQTADWSALILATAAVLLFTGRMPTTRRIRPFFLPMWPRLRNAADIGIAAFGRSIAPWIPELDARALGAFRIALGCGLLWIVWATDVSSIPLERQRHFAVPDWELVHQIAASPRACSMVELVMLAGALLFTGGLWTRWALAGFVAAFFLSALIKLESSGVHDLGLPLVTFIGWLTVSWGDELSLDAWRRTRAGRRVSAAAPSRMYGFAIWWPGLTMGLALLAAAYAKLDQSGPEWVTGGAVKYHFVTDAANAPVDWGLWVASHDWAAVLISLGAIGLEAVFILNVFARGVGTRLAAGAIGAGLFAGLFLFQGVYWRPWLVLLLAFLPWVWLNRPSPGPVRTAIGAVPALRTTQIVAVAVFACVQVFASAARFEADPLMSNFPMYAFTYASPEHFEQSMRWRLTRLVEARAGGQDVTQRVRDLRDDDRFFLMELAEQRVPQAEGLTEDERLRRALLCERTLREMGTLPAELAFRMERRGFDWHAGRFHEYSPVRTSPVPLAALCHS